MSQSALAELYDNHGYLSQYQSDQVSEVIRKAKEDNFHITVAIVNSDDLSGYGSSMANLDLETFNNQLMSKSIGQDQRSFAMTVAVDRANSNGEMPSYRYAATNNLYLNQEFVKSIMNKDFIRTKWADTLPVALNTIQLEAKDTNSKLNTIKWIVIILIVLVVIVVLFSSDGTRYSSYDDGYYSSYSSSSDDSRSWSDGD